MGFQFFSFRNFLLIIEDWIFYISSPEILCKLFTAFIIPIWIFLIILISRSIIDLYLSNRCTYSGFNLRRFYGFRIASEKKTDENLCTSRKLGNSISWISYSHSLIQCIFEIFSRLFQTSSWNPRNLIPIQSLFIRNSPLWWIVLRAPIYSLYIFAINVEPTVLQAFLPAPELSGCNWSSGPVNIGEISLWVVSCCTRELYQKSSWGFWNKEILFRGWSYRHGAGPYRANYGDS